jgi:hypothetical protein
LRGERINEKQHGKEKVVCWPYFSHEKKSIFVKTGFFYERSSIEILYDLILPKKYKLGLREIFFSSLIYIFRQI